MTELPLDRRTMLQTAAAGVALAAAGLRPAAAGEDGDLTEGLTLSPGDVVLFQGDSITDAGRDRSREGNANDPRMLGNGYPFFLAGGLLRDHADLGLRVYNRGNSGNRVPDLQARWQKDCLDLKPRLVSILIGVNDIWRTFDSDSTDTAEDYGRQFTELLNTTAEALPETAIVVCEPFVTRTGKVTDAWFPDFDNRRAVARQVAEKAGATFVPFQAMFDEAVEAGGDPAAWCGDGVHPTIAGHALMAQTWRDVVGL